MGRIALRLCGRGRETLSDPSSRPCEGRMDASHTSGAGNTCRTPAPVLLRSARNNDIL